MAQDRLNREIRVGDWVAYAQRQSSSCWISVGKVLEVKADSYKVRGVSRWLSEPTLQRPGWVTVPDNTVVIDVATVPESYQKLF